jgi:AcrR family transcriptional regulator
VRAAVLEATLALLREEGDEFGIPQVAARAGVHETSIYRRWGSREALIVDAVRTHVGDEIPVPDTGSLRGDLVSFLGAGIAFLSSPLGAQLVRATAPASPATAMDARGAYWSHRMEEIGAMFERAATRGEIAETADRSLAVELLLAPLYFRLLITHAALDDALAGRLADFVLRSLRQP